MESGKGKGTYVWQRLPREELNTTVRPAPRQSFPLTCKIPPPGSPGKILTSLPPLPFLIHYSNPCDPVGHVGDFFENFVLIAYTSDSHL